MSKSRVAVGVIILLIGVFVILMFQVSFDKLIGAAIALVGLIVMLLGARKDGTVGYVGGGKGGLQGTVKNLKREGNIASFWLEVSGQAGRTVPVEAYLQEDAVSEGDTVWVRGTPPEGAIMKTSEVRNLSRLPSSPGLGSPQMGGGGTGPSGGVRVLLILGWLILSAILAFIIVFVVMNLGFTNELLVDEESRNIAGYMILFSSFAILQVIMYKSGALSRRSRLDQLSTGVQSDLQSGFLEATARNVANPDKRVSGQGFSARYHRVQRFRAELTDKQGNITRYVPVEVECEEDKWVGEISDGDKVRMQGKFGKDGILHAEKALNLTTNSIVGKR
jgi:hypothetical protein